LRTARISADAIVGIGIALLGVAFAVATARIEVQPVYAKVGPTFVPWLVSAGLIVTGSLMAWAGLHGPPPPDHEVKTEWRPVAWIFLGLIADWLLFKPAGFIIASTVLFFCVARGFGSRSALWDALLGAMLAIAAYLLFRYGLNLNLPGFFAGIWR
jgi:putative tricarboxylic transport membrane protein